MDQLTEQFIRDQNIHHYRMLLERVTDKTEKKILPKLLADEEAKQAEILPLKYK